MVWDSRCQPCIGLMDRHLRHLQLYAPLILFLETKLLWWATSILSSYTDFTFLSTVCFSSAKHDGCCWEPNVSRWKWQTGNILVLTAVHSKITGRWINYKYTMVQVSNLVVGVTTGKKWHLFPHIVLVFKIVKLEIEVIEFAGQPMQCPWHHILLIL